MEDRYIRNPFQLDETFGYLEPHNQVVDTSGNYEQSNTINGKEFGQIIDPGTGYPVKRTASKTIITGNAALADALSTAIFIPGHEKGLELIEKIPRTEGIIINADGSRYMSPGFDKLLK